MMHVSIPWGWDAGKRLGAEVVESVRGREPELLAER